MSLTETWFKHYLEQFISESQICNVIVPNFCGNSNQNLDAEPHPFSICVSRLRIPGKHPDIKYILCIIKCSLGHGFMFLPSIFYRKIWGLHQVDSLYLLSLVLKIKGIKWKALPKCRLVLSLQCLVHSGHEEEKIERSYTSRCWSLPHLSLTLTSSKICQGS